MIERLIKEVKDRNSREPISQDEFEGWQRNPVTIRMFEDIEMSILDSYQSYVTDTFNADEIVVQVSKRDGAAEMVENILDWRPAGLRGPDDEDN